MAKEQTMESMLQQAIQMEDAEKAKKKGQLSSAINWGLTGVKQLGGGLSAWNDARGYTGFEEDDEVVGAVTANAMGRLAQGDIVGAAIALFRGDELQAQERRKRQKEKQMGIKNQLRELRRGKEKDERTIDQISQKGIEEARNYAAEAAFAGYGTASGVASGGSRRRVRGSAVRAQAAAEAPARYLAQRLDELADVERILGQEHAEALENHPGRLKYQDALQAELDDVMRLD